MNKQTMINIRDEVNALLEKAYENGVRGAINWGDLKVIDVRWSVGIDGDEIYQVWIDEASPDCPALHQYLCDNYSGVEFFTEW